MKINSIILKGWRSFSGDEGIMIDSLSKVNIFVGANNSGKSNLFKYLYHIREMVRKVQPKQNKRDELDGYDLLNGVPLSFRLQDTWAEEGSDIVCTIEVDESENLGGEALNRFHETSEIRLKVHHKIDDQKTCFSIMYDNQFTLLEEFQNTNPKVFNPNTSSFVSPVEGIGYPNHTVLYWRSFLDSLVFVDPVRHYSRNRPEYFESDFDGSNIIQEIIELRNEHDTDWREFKLKIEEWLKAILFEPEIILDPTNERLRFYIRRGRKTIATFLENLGTGVSQLIMLLSYLYLNRSRPLNVFIEEPESNLHPEAVIQLVKIMEDNFTLHRFFITTHSSILIDQVNNNWTIHRVYRKEENASKVLPCTEILQQYSVLDELGIRPSQLLQSNIIIWVEGPSDRTYVNKWISDNSNLIEGKHYSFLMYGGANLASHNFFDDIDYINILKTSRYSIILCDSDKVCEEDDLKKRVAQIIDRVDSMSFDDGMKLKDYVYIWVTEGREIENYIPKDLFESVIFSEQNVRKYMYVDNGSGQKVRKDLKYKLDSVELDKFQSFDVFFANKYLFEDDRKLDSKQISNISTELSQKKSSLAKSIASIWESRHYDQKTDLSKRVADIIEHIKKANYFGGI